MRILIPSLAIAGLALAAAPAAAETPSHYLYQEPFAATPWQPAATWVAHDGRLYAEPFSPVLAEPGPGRPALATTSAPYTEPFSPVLAEPGPDRPALATTSAPHTEPFTPSLTSAASPTKTPQACACACGHEGG